MPEVAGQPKVPNLEGHVAVEKEVAQLQVPVEDPLHVDVPGHVKSNRKVTLYPSVVDPE